MKMENNHMQSSLSYFVFSDFRFFSIQLAQKIAQVFESNRFFYFSNLWIESKFD